MSLAYGTRLSVTDKQGIEHNILQGFYMNSSNDSILDSDDMSTEQDSIDVDYEIKDIGTILHSDDSNKSTHSMVENHELYVTPNSPHSEPKSELSDDMDILDFLMEDVPQMSPHSEPRSELSDDMDILDFLMEDVPQTSPHSEPRSELSDDVDISDFLWRMCHKHHHTVSQEVNLVMMWIFQTFYGGCATNITTQ